MEASQPTPASGAPTRRPLPWILLGLLGLILLAGGLLLWQRKGVFGVPLTRREPRMVNVPAVLKPYVDRAVQGDTQAMRMLGTMYYYGLSVTQDKEEGRRWFRKAAEAGDPLAQKELGQLEAVLPR
jgi:TPR repeat protein